MPVTAKLKYLRVAPRKVRLVANLIRGKTASQAQDILRFTVKKAAKDFEKLLKSALANARNNFKLEEGNLFISKITVDEGPKLKRWMPRARGSATEIQKKTSHITLILDEIKKGKKKIKKEKVAKVEEKIGEEKVLPKPEKPKLRPELEIKKPKTQKGIMKIFRRKAFSK